MLDLLHGSIPIRPVKNLLGLQANFLKDDEFFRIFKDLAKIFEDFTKIFMKIVAKIFKIHAKTFEQGSSIFAENREELGQNFWNIEKEKKRESRRQADEAQREKEKRRARARDKKNKGDIIFLLEVQHENFVATVGKWEMLAATEVNISGSKKKSEQEHMRHFLHETCN